MPLQGMGRPGIDRVQAAHRFRQQPVGAVEAAGFAGEADRRQPAEFQRFPSLGEADRLLPLPVLEQGVERRFRIRFT